MKKIILIVICLVFSATCYTQCANTNNIYSFEYNSKTYQVIRENRTWTEAAICAVELGGILAEINDQNEQNAIFDELLNNAGINVANTVAPDGGGASYVWIGGNDIATEGVWIWDGDNDGSGPQFWMGDLNGNPVGGLYNNWGNEPDDFGSGQDALGLALTDWPMGVMGEWNDLDDTNTLYYVVEYSTLLSINDLGDLNNKVSLYPNPSFESFSIGNNNNIVLNYIEIFNVNGQKIDPFKNVTSDDILEIDISNFRSGVYFVKIHLDNVVITKKIIKK